MARISCLNSSIVAELMTLNCFLMAFLGFLIRLVIIVFGEKAFEKFGKLFISMHFSDQHNSSHRRVLIFKFALPAADHMADITRLVALIPYYIDLIGRYKLSSQARTQNFCSSLIATQFKNPSFANNFSFTC
ncbi:putative PAT complex subunit CCDC47 protein [Helianthus annuus]|nr:putative PAT complex subunit CCDC47 protein [Helianthus annuus]